MVEACKKAVKMKRELEDKDKVERYTKGSNRERSRGEGENSRSARINKLVRDLE